MEDFMEILMVILGVWGTLFVIAAFVTFVTFYIFFTVMGTVCVLKWVHSIWGVFGVLFAIEMPLAIPGGIVTFLLSTPFIGIVYTYVIIQNFFEKPSNS